MSEFNDEWRELDYTPAVDRWITRQTQRWPEPEKEPDREGKNGPPFMQSVVDAYLASGGKINYCEARLAEQQLADDRYYKKLIKRPFGDRCSPLDFVTDCIAAWDSSNYLSKLRAVVSEILAKHRNQMHRIRDNMTPRERRHQQALRIVRALAFKGMTVADYCRRHKLDPADASRMLAHLYEKESGLADGINAICVCAAITSWQNRQQNKLARLRERARKEVKLTFGWNHQLVDLEPYPSQASIGCMRSSNPGTKWWLSLTKDKSPMPSYLTWSDATLPLIIWNAAHQTERYEPFRDRYRPITRKVLLKGGLRKTWRIARALPIAPRLPLPCCVYQYRAVPDIWRGFDPRQIVGIPYQAHPTDDRMPPSRYEFLLMVTKDGRERWVYPQGRAVIERKWNGVRMCNPTRCIPLPLFRSPHGSIRPFSQLGPIRWIGPLRRATAKDYADFFARQVTTGTPH